MLMDGYFGWTSVLRVYNSSRVEKGCYIMTRRKSAYLKWTLVLLTLVLCPSVHMRPQDTSSVKPEITTETTISSTRQNTTTDTKSELPSYSSSTTATPETPRDVKTKVPIRDSIKFVANQLLEKPENDSLVTADIRIPPKIKAHTKQKIKTRNEDTEETENSHAGVAVPIAMEELETENIIIENESTTSNEGISTWVLVSSPISSNTTVSTEPTKTEDVKKQKPSVPKTKNKKQPNKPAKRPVIGSTNKSDLIAGGSAINENVYNKIKDTVLSNVQKNKATPTQKTTTVKITSPAPSTEVPTTKKAETPIKLTSTTSETRVTTKPKKKKNKNKVRTTTEEPFINESALLPMEAKGPEIELEVSTPPVTTKKPKRSATRKKTKTKKRKTTKPKPEESTTSLAEIKTSNKTKSAKPGKKPQPVQGAITSQLYNYFSREVMPSVGVGMLGLASIVGIASYFLYPFSTPVRRTFEVDKRDDLYKNNAEDYANEGNGQAEEEMLGTVLAGMPAHAKNKLNPYAGQTAYINRYPAKKEQPQQDIRYRHVATKYEPNYNIRYPQQKTGLAHGVVYSKPVNYSPHYETRHAYTTEGQFHYDKLPTSYSPYAAPAVEPIYAAPQTGPSSSSDISSYGNDASNSVVYGVKPSAESDFKPVYPFESQFHSEVTNNPVTYAPNSLYLGSNNEAEESEDTYTETSSEMNDTDENKFVVGNVPKELSDSATPAVVPEHGPRKLTRKKRNTSVKRSISSSLEELLKTEKDNNIFLSNEIDDSIVMPIRNLAPITQNIPFNEDLPTTTKPEEVYTVYAAPVDSTKIDLSTSVKNEVIESVSTVPINSKGEKTTTESYFQNDVEVTTKAFHVYEVFSSPDVTSSPIINKGTVIAETTSPRNMMTETTTELKSETTSILPSTQSSFTDSKDPGSPTLMPTPIVPDIMTYPPLNEPLGFFSFLRRLVDFKVRLGLSILQSTSDSLNRFLKNVESPTTTTSQRFAKASQTFKKTQ